jgi:hypothetical protein
MLIFLFKSFKRNIRIEIPGTTVVDPPRLDLANIRFNIFELDALLFINEEGSILV